MCCVLNITEAGMQPDQPRSQTSQQFSIIYNKTQVSSKVIWGIQAEDKWKRNDTDRDAASLPLGHGGIPMNESKSYMQSQGRGSTCKKMNHIPFATELSLAQTPFVLAQFSHKRCIWSHF